MADRTLLHINKLPMFTWWLNSLGYEIQQTKGVWEVLRAKKNNDLILVFRKVSAKEHLTIQQKDFGLVKKFIRQHVEIERKWRVETNE